MSTQEPHHPRPAAPAPQGFVARHRGCLISAAIMAGIFVLGCGGLFLAGYSWFERNGDRLRTEGQAARAEGEAAGPGRTPEECFSLALDRTSLCEGDLDFTCRAMAEQYHLACLETCDRPADFCVGVPPETEIMESARFRVAHCQTVDPSLAQACQRLVGNAQRVCHGLP